MKAAFRIASEKAILPKALQFFGYLICVVFMAYVVGQKIALPLFIAVYLWRWGRYGWRISLFYGMGGWLFIIGFYDQVMHLFWHPSWLSSWLPSVMPAWLPAWLII